MKNLMDVINVQKSNYELMNMNNSPRIRKKKVSQRDLEQEFQKWNQSNPKWIKMTWIIIMISMLKQEHSK